MNLPEIAKSVCKIAGATGLFIQEEGNKFDRNQAKYKGTNDLVSYVDKESERQLVKELSVLVPEAGFITEEGTTSGPKGVLNWVIDPLDGTTNFVHGLPIYAISVALVEDGKPLVGVVRDVEAGVNYWAVASGGAFMEDEAICVSSVNNLGEGLYATGFPVKDFKRLEKYMSIMTAVMKQAHGLRRLGSAAMDMVYVARGLYEGYFEFNLHPWDVAAGILLVKEAGGKVTDFSGGTNYLFGGEVVAAGAVHPELMKVIKKYW